MIAAPFVRKKSQHLFGPQSLMWLSRLRHDLQQQQLSQDVAAVALHKTWWPCLVACAVWMVAFAGIRFGGKLAALLRSLPLVGGGCSSREPSYGSRIVDVERHLCRGWRCPNSRSRQRGAWPPMSSCAELRCPGPYSAGFSSTSAVDVTVHNTTAIGWVHMSAFVSSCQLMSAWR